MELRVSPAMKKIIREAMALSGQSAAELAYAAARRVIEEHERQALVGRDREAFLAAVRSPPPPSAKLIAALKKHDALRNK